MLSNPCPSAPSLCLSCLVPPSPLLFLYPSSNASARPSVRRLVRPFILLANFTPIQPIPNPFATLPTDRQTSIWEMLRWCMNTIASHLTFDCSIIKKKCVKIIKWIVRTENTYAYPFSLHATPLFLFLSFFICMMWSVPRRENIKKVKKNKKGWRR